LALLLFLMGPVRAAGGAETFVSRPPRDYSRQVVLRVLDLHGSPLPGVRALLTEHWCRIVPEGDPISDEEGIIRFQLRHVVENTLEGEKVTDLFLTYRAVFMYRLAKDGYMETVGEVEDVQEFASFTHPLYYGLNRRPETAPLRIDETLAAYRDYLARPEKGENLRTLVEEFASAGLAANVRPIPGSVEPAPGGVLRLGIRFLPLFDPEKFGLVEAGRALLRDPVRDSLAIIRYAYPDYERIAAFEFMVEAGFQYRTNQFPEPEWRTYKISIPAKAAKAIQDWSAGGPFPYDGVDVELPDG
jgi:hypothetical protein